MSNLPPSCTDHDIDRAAGYYADCEACGREVEAETLDSHGVCPKCLREDE